MNVNDYVVRIWPSGTMTMGKVDFNGREQKNREPFFHSLESYPYEGGVLEGKLYGVMENLSSIKYKSTTYEHRLATPLEIQVFKLRGKLQLKEEDLIPYQRDFKLGEIIKDHLETIDRYSGTMYELVENIGDLKYDALADFLQMLSEKLSRDSDGDVGRGRVKLAKELKEASEHISEAWRISKPFMK